MNKNDIDTKTLANRLLHVPFIGCLPLSFFPKPSAEQKGCQKEKCSDCQNAIWVCEKKREMRTITGYTCVCWFCLLEKIREMGLRPDGVQMVDILKNH